MRFVVGTVALLVILAVVVSPALLLLGWLGIADLRQIAATSAAVPPPMAQPVRRQ
ncbi:MAG: hypothetical protein AB7G54_02335 [Methyloceanibacter sp.]